MQIKNRIDLMVRLGKYLQQNDKELEEIKTRANHQNSWFTPEFIDLAIKNIRDNFLHEDKLLSWVKNYALNDETSSKKVGIVMAGNIPLVGFHDLLCVFVAGHKAVIRTSSKDEVLVKHLVQKLEQWDGAMSSLVTFAENLKGCDAYIATGSGNTSRYFEYYFGKYPSIIRRNRSSVAVLDGTETREELDLLSNDMQLYFGLGCRNVTKIFVPDKYDFLPILEAVRKYAYFLDFHKYKHNYDYQLALLIMNNKFYMSSDPLIFAENESVFSPVSQVHYEYYAERNVVLESVRKNSEIQCIIGHGMTGFGQAQSPSLMDYADGVDTMKFLCQLT